MRIGDRVTKKPTIEGAREPLTGRVVYINRAHGFYTVEFTVDGRRFKESFLAPYRCGKRKKEHLKA